MSRSIRLLTGLLTLCATAPALAQLPDTRPDLAKRVVSVFEFENTNPSFPIPEDFRRAQHDPAENEVHPGFPPEWNLAVFDSEVFYSGASAIKLPIEGGRNSGLRLRPGVLPIFRGADYVVTAQFQTRSVKHARVFLVARFLNAQMAAIPGSDVRSKPALSDNQWSQLTLNLHNPPEDAAYLQIDMELLQPKYFQSPLLAEEHNIWHEDRQAAAWFDELTVLQLPRVRLTANTPANTILAPDEPRLSIRVTDLAGERLDATLSVFDSNERLVSQEQIVIESGRFTCDTTPNLPAYGWYFASLAVEGKSGFSGATHLQFVWLPPRDQRDPDALQSQTASRSNNGEQSRFAFIVPDLGPDQRALIAPIAESLGIGSITIPLWDEYLTLATVPDTLESMATLIDRMLTRGISVSLSLARTPAQLVDVGAAPTLLPTRALDPESDRHEPFLYPFLERFGQVVRTWQFGRTGDMPSSEVSLQDPIKVISKLVPEPVLELTWRGEYAVNIPAENADHVAGLRVLIPSSTNPNHIDQQISRILEQFDQLDSTRSLTIVLEALSAQRFGHRAVADDLVKRAVGAWSVIADHPAAPTLAIAQPWSTDPATPGSIMPSPQLAVWRTVIDQLAGRRVVGQVPIGDDVTVHILAPAPQAPPDKAGALLAWRTAPSTDSTPRRLNLQGADISIVDTYGNRTPIGRSQRLADAGDAPAIANEQIRITAAPRFFEGVDVEITQFLSSIRLSPKLLNVKNLEHEATLCVTNPWKQRISGTIAIIEPGGFKPGVGRDTSWRIAPRNLDFNLAPGQTAQIPLGIEFELSQESTQVRLILDIDVAAAKPFRVTHAVPFSVGLPNLKQTLSYRYVRKGNADTIVLEARYQNIGPEDLTVEVAAFATGAGRRTASIGSLPPGQEAIRKFIYLDANKVIGQTVYVSASVSGTGGRLNNSIKIE